MFNDKNMATMQIVEVIATSAPVIAGRLITIKTLSQRLPILTPNIMVEWLAFLLRIWEVPGSNSYPETGYPV
jgi:hypothetical protein